MMGNLGLPPGVAGGRRAKKGKGESKGKVRSRVTRTRDEAGFSARLDPVFLAQYCWFLVFGSMEALLEQSVAFWTRESSVVATMAVFKVSSLSMSSVRNHVVSCLETCVPSQARPKSEVPQPASTTSHRPHTGLKSPLFHKPPRQVETLPSSQTFLQRRQRHGRPPSGNNTNGTNTHSPSPTATRPRLTFQEGVQQLLPGLCTSCMNRYGPTETTSNN